MYVIQTCSYPFKPMALTHTDLFLVHWRTAKQEWIRIQLISQDRIWKLARAQSINRSLLEASFSIKAKCKTWVVQINFNLEKTLFNISGQSFKSWRICHFQIVTRSIAIPLPTALPADVFGFRQILIASHNKTKPRRKVKKHKLNVLCCRNCIEQSLLL